MKREYILLLQAFSVGAFLILLLLAMANKSKAAELELTVSQTNFTDSENHPSTQEFKAAYGEDFYGWASYSGVDHWMVSQSMGDLDVYGLGIGYEAPLTSRVSFYMDAGLGYNQQSYKERIMKETVATKLVNQFGEPPFYPEGECTWYCLEEDQEIDEIGFLGRAGVKFQFNDRLSGHVSYMTYQLGHYYKMEDPDLNGGFDPDNPDACACRYEGKDTVDLSAFQIGVSLKF